MCELTRKFFRRTTCAILGWDPTETSHTASVGELNPNCEAKIMADDGVTELGRNQRGELWVRGPNIMKGYWRNPQATKETKTEDGWLKTGDIAYVDDQGKFYVVDRKKVRRMTNSSQLPHMARKAASHASRTRACVD